MMSQYVPVPMPANPDVPRSTARLFLAMSRPFTGRLSAFFSLTFIGALAWAAAPFVVSRIITELSVTHRLTANTWTLVVMYGVLGLVNEVCWRIGENILRTCKPQMVESVRWRLFAAVLQRPHAFFVNASSGRIGHWINQVTETTDNFIDTTVWTVWNQATTLVVAAAFLLATHWSLAVLFIAWMIILLAYNMHRGKRYGQLVEAVSDEQSKAAGLVVDAVGNHVSVRAFSGQATERQLLATQQRAIIHRWQAAWMQNIWTNAVKGQSVAYVTTAALVVVLVLYAHALIPVGAIVLFIAYFGEASNAVWQLAWAFDTYYRNFATIQNALDGLQDVNERRADSSTVKWRLPKAAALRLEDVTFVYPEQPDERVLDGLNLRVAAHETVGIVGPSGAGKSTLVGLLLGFFEPLTGTIRLGDRTMQEYGPQLIRDQAAYVPQDTNLFNRTIRENVLYARPDASEAEVLAALEKAQAMEFVARLPKGLDARIGERGVKLSGGQRQRIAIARALLQDKPLLILDEATSALDSISEQAIQKALFELMHDRTAIVIAHRLSTLRNLDRIIVLDNGRILEEGTHEQLVAGDGLYADMWKRQKNGFVGD